MNEVIRLITNNWNNIELASLKMFKPNQDLFITPSSLNTEKLN